MSHQLKLRFGVTWSYKMDMDPATLWYPRHFDLVLEDFLESDNVVHNGGCNYQQSDNEMKFQMQKFNLYLILSHKKSLFTGLLRMVTLFTNKERKQIVQCSENKSVWFPMMSKYMLIMLLTFQVSACYDFFLKNLQRP